MNKLQNIKFNIKLSLTMIIFLIGFVISIIVVYILYDEFNNKKYDLQQTELINEIQNLDLSKKKLSKYKDYPLANIDNIYLTFTQDLYFTYNTKEYIKEFNLRTLSQVVNQNNQNKNKINVDLLSNLSIKTKDNQLIKQLKTELSFVFDDSKSKTFVDIEKLETLILLKEMIKNKPIFVESYEMTDKTIIIQLYIYGN